MDVSLGEMNEDMFHRATGVKLPTINIKTFLHRRNLPAYLTVKLSHCLEIFINCHHSLLILPTEVGLCVEDCLM